MIKVASYNAAINNGEPKIHAEVGKPTKWRLDLFAKRPGAKRPERVIIRVEDPMWISDVFDVAAEQLATLIPDGTPCEESGFDLWADA